MLYKIIKMNLHLFDEEMADNTNADDSQQQTYGDEGFEGDQDGNEDTETVGDNEAEETEEGDNTESQSTLTTEDRQAQYEAMKQEYKDFYSQDFQKAFNERFKEHKTLESQYNALLPIVEGLKQMYGVEDINEAAKMFKQYQVEALAEEAGMTPEQYTEYMDYKIKAQQFEQMQQQQQQSFEMQQKVDGWFKEAEQLQNKYPQFDLKKAADNLVFMDLLEKGVSVEQAYEATHIQEIIANAAAQTEKQVVSNIQSRKLRPGEVALNQQQSATIKSTLGSTYEDRQKIRERVRRGEHVTF